MDGKSSVNFHLLQFTRVLRVLLGVKSLLNVSLVVIFIYLVVKKSQSDSLLKCVLFGGVAPVAVTAHKSLNSSKGVVTNWELARTDPEEIKENVPMITDVQRIVVKRNNTEIKTNTLILTFNTPKIHDSLKICYLNIPVSQYVPNPIRCYKCQRFGHVTSKCKHNEVCARCSATGHKDDTCTRTCEENHALYNKKCSFYKREFDIKHIRVNIGRFYYDKSTKTLFDLSVSHDRLEIKDIRCIHQGIEKKKKDGRHFVSLNVLILNWKKQFSLYTI